MLFLLSAVFIFPLFLCFFIQWYCCCYLLCSCWCVAVGEKSDLFYFEIIWQFLPTFQWRIQRIHIGPNSKRILNSYQKVLYFTVLQFKTFFQLQYYTLLFVLYPPTSYNYLNHYGSSIVINYYIYPANRRRCFNIVTTFTK